MGQQTTLTEAQVRGWGALVERAIANAITGLSHMVRQEVRPSSLRASTVPVEEVASLVGGPEAVSVGVYLRVTGSATGHMVLVYRPDTAFGLVDLLMGRPPGSTRALDEMEQSALGEMGNIMGSYFLNSLADASGLRLHPSPPAVMMDMAAAILQVALADMVVETDEVLVVDSVFGTTDRQISGRFLVMPTYGLVRTILAGLGS